MDCGDYVIVVNASKVKVTGRKLNVEYAGRRAGDPGMLTASSAEAEKLLGWRPEYTDIEEIIRTMWQLER